MPRKRRNYVPLFITLLALVAVAGMWELFLHTEAKQYDQRSQVAHSTSDIKLALEIDYDNGPLVSETYSMRNDNGVSTSRYRAVGRAGTAITIDSTPRETFDVTFFFERLVADGVWNVKTKPPRGNTSTHYKLDVYQLVDGQHGAHTVEFTDPHFWAITGGHEFTIHLDKNKPVPDLLTLKATSVQDPRYEKLIADFRDFGTPSFKTKVAQAQNRLHRGS